MNTFLKNRGTEKGVSILFTGVAPMIVFVLVSPPGALGANQVCDGERHDCGCASATPCWCCDEAANFGETCGNCVWWAWHEACCNWDVALEWCTNANTWDENARDYGYDVGTSPEVNSIFVRNAGTWGHVGWVVTVYPSGQYDTTEMNCMVPPLCGVQNERRDPGFADVFIYDPHPEPPPPDEAAPEPEPDPVVEEPAMEPVPDVQDAPAVEPADISVDGPEAVQDLPPDLARADEETGETPSGALGLESGCGCVLR
jgi:surface antigen